MYVKLTPKQKAFCQYYIQSENATEAAIKAGYSKKTVKENAVWLVRHLMNKHDIPIGNVVQRNKWSGKNCPRRLRASGWSAFINLIKSNPTAVAPLKDLEMYDLSYLKDYKLVGIRSSKHPNEIRDKVTWAMEANANCVLLLKRDFDLRILQKALNEMYPKVK